MISTWDRLAQRHNPKKKFVIGKIDCTSETDLCSDHDILGYPTLDCFFYLKYSFYWAKLKKIFNFRFIFYQKGFGQGDVYDGQRDFDSMEYFLLNQIKLDNTPIVMLEKYELYKIKFI